MHGIRDWYKSLNERRKKGRAFAANVDVKSERMQGTSMGSTAEMMCELIKLLQKANTPSNPITSYAKANTPLDPITNYANFPQLDEEYAGNAAKISCIDLDCYIIQSRAINHVCESIVLFHSFVKPTNPHFIHLPDGSKNSVQFVGRVKLNNDITLENVFGIPQFSVNFISVSQLYGHTNYQF